MKSVALVVLIVVSLTGCGGAKSAPTSLPGAASSGSLGMPLADYAKQLDGFTVHAVSLKPSDDPTRWDASNDQTGLSLSAWKNDEGSVRQVILEFPTPDGFLSGQLDLFKKQIEVCVLTVTALGSSTKSGQVERMIKHVLELDRWGCADLTLIRIDPRFQIQVSRNFDARQVRMELLP